MEVERGTSRNTDSDAIVRLTVGSGCGSIFLQKVVVDECCSSCQLILIVTGRHGSCGLYAQLTTLRRVQPDVELIGGRGLDSFATLTESLREGVLTGSNLVGREQYRVFTLVAFPNRDGTDLLGGIPCQTYAILLDIGAGHGIEDLLRLGLERTVAFAVLEIGPIGRRLAIGSTAYAQEVTGVAYQVVDGDCDFLVAATLLLENLRTCCDTLFNGVVQRVGSQLNGINSCSACLEDDVC